MANRNRGPRGPQSRKDRTRAKIAAQRAAQQRREARRRLLWTVTTSVVVVGVIAALVVVGLAKKKTSSTTTLPLTRHAQVLPPAVGTGRPDVQPAALAETDTSGIPGVVSYDTAGWPTSSHNGPPKQALPHTHVNGPIVYSVTPPVGGDHNPVWMNCGVYDQPVPTERAVHNLEHGAIWITYQPTLPSVEVQQLLSFFGRQKAVVIAGTNTGSRYLDLTPYPGLPAPIVMSAWGHQLRLTSATDPRMQQFVNAFRVNPRQTPEYGAACTGGVGTPLYT